MSFIAKSDGCTDLFLKLVHFNAHKFKYIDCVHLSIAVPVNHFFYIAVIPNCQYFSVISGGNDRANTSRLQVERRAIVSANCIYTSSKDGRSFIIFFSAVVPHINQSLRQS